jgi:hypothetical protein
MNKVKQLYEKYGFIINVIVGLLFCVAAYLKWSYYDVTGRGRNLMSCTVFSIFAIFRFIEAYKFYKKSLNK